MRVLQQRIPAISISLVLSVNLALAAQQCASPREASLREWSSANLRWLTEQITPNKVVPDPDPARRRLVISYAIPPEQFPQGYHRSSTYDNALAALAFTVVGEYDVAAFTLHALARLVRPDGSLWFGYNTANEWPGELDHEGALVRAGAVSWVGYALAFYLAHHPPCVGDQGRERELVFFRRTANRLADYLVSLQVNAAGDPRDGLVRLGFAHISLAYKPDIHQVIEQYTDGPYPGISTENNISTWFFLRQLFTVTGEARWQKAAERIRERLLSSVWNDKLGQFNQGFTAGGTPDPIMALDCASWGALFLAASGDPERARQALGDIDSTYASRDGMATGFRPYSNSPIYQDPQVGKFFFPESPQKEWRNLPLVWSEGTLGVALAHMRLGGRDRAIEVIEGLKPLQAENSGLAYASRDVKFYMRSAPGAASAAWLILAVEALCGNPEAAQVWR